MPPSPSKMEGDENFRKKSDVGMGGHKTFNFEDRVKFFSEGLKRFTRKMKTAYLNCIYITLKLCKIYVYSVNISFLSP